ncbi:DUF5665 domain-containing protein [Pelosinus propionicus]|uniref:Uncharacterized protein n=1 Tax=Pelosinus propionicus DSM 13327 TaxID=1123291 RepID=A0A1I4I3U8_9FIRM|nr:DUF5665 domain-containing protein [Pelosinus propionicus]SFL48924.1 hypothetical protein SAMN04490355_100698 [Pelosinus propionicus DSM 13327]
MELKKENVPLAGADIKKIDLVNRAEACSITLEKLVYHLEAMRIAEYLEMLENPKKIIINNFLAGIARGLGMAVGASVIFAIAIEMLRRFVIFNMFGLGSFMAEFMKIIDTQK